MSLSRYQASRLVKRVLSQASFGDVRVRITDAQTGHLRFALNQPTTSGDVEELSIRVTATKGKRHATVTGNRTDDKGLAELVQRAEALAALAPEDPEHMPALGKTRYGSVAEVDRQVARMTALERAALVGQAIKKGKGEGMGVAGFLRHGQRAVAVGDRAGLFGHHTRTRVAMAVTCRTPDATGSSKAGFVGHRLAPLGAASLAADAADWAARSKGPKGIDPGRYTVVLAPQAVADLLSFFIGRALSHRRASEGRSYFAAKGGATKLGEKLFSDNVTLFSDPADKADPASPIARDGRPQGKVTWVDKGVLAAMTSSRFWAAKKGVPSRPQPSSLHMAGGTDDLDALIKGVDKGVLVSRFWYNRILSPRTILATGLTRDGTFWIEGGKIARPIKNLRYNESPITLLKRLVALGRPERAGLATRRVMVVPPLVVENFNFESVSDAV